MSSTTFTDLLASSGVDGYDDEDDFQASGSFSLYPDGEYPERTGSGLPKFKTAQPPPLPISQSSHLAASDFLDSPLLLSSSHTLISPTTGAYPFQGFNGTTHHSDFIWLQKHQLQPSNPSDLQETYSFQNVQKQEVFATEQVPISYEITGQNSQSDERQRQGRVPSYMVSRNSDDGYGWRKYGQKQVKKSENPRSYFKCTYPNCVSKKIVETASDGQVTEIIYKGGHNHPKPEFTKRPSASSSCLASNARRLFNPSVSETHDQSENSSISFDYSDLEQRGLKSEEIEGEEDQTVTKRKREVEDEGMSIEVSRGVKEPRVVVQTISDIDVLIDGFRWRKYGQKVVKGNTNPRSYYKCTYQGCGVRKQVERSADDERAVLTTYEGRHNHDIPTSLRRS